MLGPLVRLLDRLDERRASRLRRAWGPKGRLVSWRRIDAGGWNARLSGPEWPETIERHGRTRRAAILRAAVVLEARAGLGEDCPKTIDGRERPRTANDIEGLSWP